jgi:hypothetical protein
MGRANPNMSDLNQMSGTIAKMGCRFRIPLQRYGQKQLVRSTLVRWPSRLRGGASLCRGGGHGRAQPHALPAVARAERMGLSP